MKPKFIINKFGAQDKSPTYDTYLEFKNNKSKILDDIAMHLIKTKNYDIEWKNERAIGRLIFLETDKEKYYISLSQYGKIEGRNYQVQSIPTAFSVYLNESNKIKKNSSFHFYFLPFSGNNETNYMIFFYRIMITIGMNIINSDYGLKQTSLKKFENVHEIILERNTLRDKNSGNLSTYITDEGDFFHIYGKTFGANQKETTLLCFALSKISEKPIKLFQITDNNSESLSSKDKEAIKKFYEQNKFQMIQILDDTYQFESSYNNQDNNNIRNPKFIYNLLNKFGEKKCALCNCKIERLVQAAHIYPVAAIKSRKDLTFTEKQNYATDCDNGIWLCENHHKLFDSDLLMFDNGNCVINNELSNENISFIEKITPNKKIDITGNMKFYFSERMGSVSKFYPKSLNSDCKTAAQNPPKYGKQN